MPSPGKLEFQTDHLVISGDWTLANYARLKREVQTGMAKDDTSEHSVSLASINALDTAGASLLAELLGAQR